MGPCCITLNETSIIIYLIYNVYIMHISVSSFDFVVGKLYARQITFGSHGCNEP